MRDLNRVFGIILLLAGIALLIVGVNASHSVMDHVSDTIAGRPAPTAAWYILGGSASALLAILMMRFGVRAINA